MTNMNLSLEIRTSRERLLTQTPTKTQLILGRCSSRDEKRTKQESVVFIHNAVMIIDTPATTDMSLITGAKFVDFGLAPVRKFHNRFSMLTNNHEHPKTAFSLGNNHFTWLVITGSKSTGDLASTLQV